jgi:hypothetical protein
MSRKIMWILYNIHHRQNPFKSICVLLYFLMGWDWVHLVLWPLLAYCTSPQMIDDDDCGAVSWMRINRGKRSTRRKPAPIPLCLTQIPHDLTRARTRAAGVGNQRLIAWAMARLLPCGNSRKPRKSHPVYRSQFWDSTPDHPKTKALLPATLPQGSMKLIALSGKQSVFCLHVYRQRISVRNWGSGNRLMVHVATCLTKRSQKHYAFVLISGELCSEYRSGGTSSPCAVS